MAVPIPNLNLNTKSSSDAKSNVQKSVSRTSANNYGTQINIPWYAVAAVGVALYVLTKHRKG